MTQRQSKHFPLLEVLLGNEHGKILNNISKAKQLKQHLNLLAQAGEDRHVDKIKRKLKKEGSMFSF